MKIETKYYGSIEVDKKEIVKFPQGIPGFLDKKEFVLFRLNDESPFLILQSVEDAELAFITLTPWDIYPDYEFEISNAVEDSLKIKEAGDIVVLIICTIRDSLEKMTVNFAAPVLINYKENLGKQVVLDDQRYSTKQPVFSEQQRQEAR